MLLYITGGDCRYVAEQTAQTLFPEEKHIWTENPPGQDVDAAEAVIAVTPHAITAEVTVRRGGKASRESRTLELSAACGDYERERRIRFLLQRTMFDASLPFLAEVPPWGALSGVRPAKLARKLIYEYNGDAAAAEKALREAYALREDKAHLAAVCAEEAVRLIESRKKNDVDVYVGIPFCPTRCSYCSFVSAAVGKQGSLLQPYTEALCGEIQGGSALLRELGMRVRTVYVGGGTPTTLSASQLDMLMRAIGTLPVVPGFEFTVEAGRPDTLTQEKLDVLYDAGVRRVSINPQSMTDEVLRAVARPHTAADVERAYAMAHRFPVVNMDLIAGLPLETAESFARSLKRVTALRPANVTVHTLALKRGTDMHEAAHRNSPASLIAEMLEVAERTLRPAYKPYYLYRQKYIGGSFENIGWTMPGAVCDYNIAMMEETGPVFAFGAGSVTKLVDGDRVRRVHDPKYAAEYLRAAQTLDAVRRCDILAALHELRTGEL